VSESAGWIAPVESGPLVLGVGFGAGTKPSDSSDDMGGNDSINLARDEAEWRAIAPEPPFESLDGAALNGALADNFEPAVVDG
jgi:hypothetical protein